MIASSDADGIVKIWDVRMVKGRYNIINIWKKNKKIKKYNKIKDVNLILDHILLIVSQ